MVDRKLALDSAKHYLKLAESEADLYGNNDLCVAVHWLIKAVETFDEPQPSTAGQGEGKETP